MADVLSPVKEEGCVSQGNELDDSLNAGKKSSGPVATTTTGLLNIGISLVWWSTLPLRTVAGKLASITSTTDYVYVRTTKSIMDIVESNIPALSEKNSSKAAEEVQQSICRTARHKVRTAIRTEIGRKILKGLDKVINASDSVVEYLEKKEVNNSAMVVQPAIALEESQDVNEVTAEVEAIFTLRVSSDVPQAESSDSAVGASEDGKISPDIITVTTSTCTIDWTVDDVRLIKLDSLFTLIKKPVNMWSLNLKYLRRYLYRTGRLRRCRLSRTPAKYMEEISKRPKASPKKHPKPNAFMSVFKFALSPITGRKTKSKFRSSQGVHTPKSHIGHVKRKFSNVDPYSCGDDSDDDADNRVMVNYLDLHDYDSASALDSDYEFNTSDDMLTSDSEEYRTDSDEEALENEVDDIQKDDVDNGTADENRTDKLDLKNDDTPSNAGPSNAESQPSVEKIALSDIEETDSSLDKQTEGKPAAPKSKKDRRKSQEILNSPEKNQDSSQPVEENKENIDTNDQKESELEVELNVHEMEAKVSTSL